MCMSGPRQNLDRSEIAENIIINAAIAAMGAGTSAAIRGTSVKESIAVVGLGTGLYYNGLGLFSMHKAQKLNFPQTALLNALGELIGTTIGYAGTRLFINAAVSTEPFVNAALGFPVSVGALFCVKILWDYYHQDTPVNTLRPRS